MVKLDLGLAVIADAFGLNVASLKLFFLQIDFDDVAAINPELLQLPPLHPKDNLPLQENVTIQVGACHS